MSKHNRRIRPPRPGSLRDLHGETSGRMKNALAPTPAPLSSAATDDLLLIEADRLVRRRFRWQKTIPLNLLTMLPGLLFIGTRSKAVLALFVLTYPLALVVRAVLARFLSARIGSEEVLLRREYERLLAEQKRGLTE